MFRNRRSPGRKLARLSLIGVFFVAAVCGMGLNAGASPYGFDAGAPEYLPDSQDHWFCYDQTVPSGDRPRYASAMDYLDLATSMYDQYATSCGTSTDIVFAHNSPICVPDFGCSGIRGYTPCDRWIGAYGLCDKFIVYVDPLYIFTKSGGFNGPPGLFDNNFAATIRHEIGHTGGLSHHTGGNADAMISGQVSTSWAYLGYASHDICHINNFLTGVPASC